jgi:hypothetical protein
MNFEDAQRETAEKKQQPAECAACGAKLDEPADLPVEDRKPCPACGSTGRVAYAAAKLTGTVSMTADAVIVRAWDGVSLTLFGVVYGVVVTIVGVWVARLWWLWMLVYVLLSLALLGFFLLVIPQHVIAWARWLTERGKTVPPRPFRGRRWK